jgi:hypothetical protein
MKNDASMSSSKIFYDIALFSVSINGGFRSTYTGPKIL